MCGVDEVLTAFARASAAAKAAARGSEGFAAPPPVAEPNTWCSPVVWLDLEHIEPIDDDGSGQGANAKTLQLSAYRTRIPLAADA